MARGTKIATVFAKHGLKELFGDPTKTGPSVAAGRPSGCGALEELGPTFCKLGQILSTRPDLLPPEFIEELATLQDNVPPLTEEQVVRVMEQELGVPWEDVFETSTRSRSRRARSRRSTARCSRTARRPSSRCSVPRRRS